MNWDAIADGARAESRLWGDALRLERAHNAVAAVHAGDDLVRWVTDRIADARLDVLVELREPAVDLRQDIGVAYPAHQECRISDLAHPFQFDGVFGVVHELRSRNAHRAVGDCLVATLIGP